MIWNTRLAVVVASLLCLAAAPAPKASTTKVPALKATAAKPATPKASSIAPISFDAQNPQGLMELLGSSGAKVQTRSREDDTVFVIVTSAAANFSMQFAGCAPQGRECRAVLLDAVLDRSLANATQINAFNLTSVMCRISQDRGGAPHVLYSTLLFKSMSRDDATIHLQAWQGCLGDAGDFLKDPVAYLASAA